MAQPPDGRRPLPWETPDAVPPAEAPTVAWTPPDEPVTAPDAAPPADVAGEMTEPLTPTDPSAMPDPSATPDDPPAEPASPLISWSPSGGTAPSATPPGDGASPAVVGWAVPADTQRASPVAGFLVAGIGSRIVGYLIDGILLWIVNVAIVRIANPSTLDQDPSLAPAFSLPMLLAQLIIMGIEFAYFVGFWTSRGRATIGMRLVRIQLIDARGDKPLQVVPAAARWLLLSGALGLIGLLPLPVGISGIAATIWIVLLLVSVVNNPLRQGVHDQAAGSLVVQRVGANSNVAVVGCLLLTLLFIVLPIVSLIALGSQMEEILREVGQSI